jgi:hypothetical protein
MPASLIGFLSVNVVVFWDNTLLPEGNLPLPAPLMFISQWVSQQIYLRTIAYWNTGKLNIDTSGLLPT